MEGISILSANVQGLGDKFKRKDVFSYLRNNNYNIYCLQDTHFLMDNENLIRSEWGYNCHFNSFENSFEISRDKFSVCLSQH